MSQDFLFHAGEATVLAKEGQFTDAMPEILIGRTDGPVGQAFANMMAQTKGHTAMFAIRACNQLVRPATMLVPKVTGSEDFSFFQRVVPGLFVFLGVTAPGTDPRKAAPNHSPRFHVDDSGLLLGVLTLAHLSCDYIESPN